MCIQVSPEIAACRLTAICFRPIFSLCVYTHVFRWALLSALHPVERNTDRVSSYVRYAQELNFTNVEFPAELEDVPKVRPFHLIIIIDRVSRNVTLSRAFQFSLMLVSSSNVVCVCVCVCICVFCHRWRKTTTSRLMFFLLKARECIRCAWHKILKPPSTSCSLLMKITLLIGAGLKISTVFATM